MGKITFNKVRGYRLWKIKSDGVVVQGSYINKIGSYYVIEANFHSLTSIRYNDCGGRLKLSKAETLEGAQDLAKEIFKNKTSLRDRAFESSLEYFSFYPRFGKDFLTPERCSEIFFYLFSDIDQILS